MAEHEDSAQNAFHFYVGGQGQFVLGGGGQFEVAFDAFQKIVTAYTWRIARKSGPTVFPMSR
jgi:hypothetical protein